MRQILNYTVLAMAWITGALIFIVPFVTIGGLPERFIAGRQFWIHASMLLFALAVTVATVYKRKEIWIPYSWSDLLMLLCGICMIGTYHWEQNLAPDRLLFFVELILFWFLLRLVFVAYPELMRFFLVLIVLSGCLEAVLGLKQIYGLSYSNHSRFLLTGTFFNPGPYSGFLAVILPVCLNEWFECRKKEPQSFYGKMASYITGGIMVLILIVLPAGMSRSAWIAAGVSVICVAGLQLGWFGKALQMIRTNKKKSFAGIIIAVLLITVSLAGIYYLKKDSADGRLLMWRMTVNAIVKQPFTGYGLGGFPHAYAEEQAAYFATSDYTEVEELVAGSPLYAFNEYLQFWIETGFWGILCFIGLIIVSLYNAFSDKRWGVLGAILSMMVFAFSSYPFQLPEFPVLLVLLLAVANYRKPGHTFKNNKWVQAVTIVYAGILSFFVYGLFYTQKDMYEVHRQWGDTKMLYQSGAYEAVIKSSEKLYPRLQHQPDFLFDYAQSLSKQKEYTSSNRILERAAWVSSDPMIYNIMGKNYQQMCQFELAGEAFRKAVALQPGRLYPYYLLAKLYAEPDFSDIEKMQEMAHIVLTKEAKVHSTAIEEMRKEVKELLKNTKNLNDVKIDCVTSGPGVP